MPAAFFPSFLSRGVAHLKFSVVLQIHSFCTNVLPHTYNGFTIADALSTGSFLPDETLDLRGKNTKVPVHILPRSIGYKSQPKTRASLWLCDSR